MGERDPMVAEQIDSSLRRWGFLFTEMVLIVASILLAFALDSWWHERKDRGEEIEILHGLHEEFSQNREILQTRIERHHVDLSALDALLDAVRHGEWISAEFTVDQSLAALLAPPTTDLGNGVLDALIYSGRIELLRDRELRARLAAWEGVFGEVSDDEHISRDLVFERVVPYMIEHAVPISGPMSTWPGEWHKSPVSIMESPAEMERLLGDASLAVLLEARIGFKNHTTGEYNDALEAIGDILDSIDRSLGVNPERPGMPGDTN